MATFELDKLVRDDFPQIYEQEGQIAEVRVVEEAKLPEAWQHKLNEELTELAAEGISLDERIGEIVDVQELLDCLASKNVSNKKTKQTHNIVDEIQAEFGIDREEIIERQAAKNAKFGSFKQGQWIVHLTVQDDSPWVEYYRDKGYPETD